MKSFSFIDFVNIQIYYFNTGYYKIPLNNINCNIFLKI